MRLTSVSRISVLAFITSFLFVASALIRAVDGTALAIANELENSGAEKSGLTDIEGKLTASQINSILQELDSRSMDLEQQELKLLNRETRLNLVYKEVKTRLAELQDAEESLRDLISLSESAAEQDLLRLTALYENMKPLDAANVFEEMEPSFAAGLLAGMDPTKAALIVQNLEAKTAYSISVLIASRNLGAPTRQ